MRHRLLAFIIFLSLTLFVDNAVAIETKDNTVCLPIVMYHQVKNYSLGKDVISPEEFESDLSYLQMNGYTTITTNELIDFFYNGGTLPSKPIILTFDDGYLNNYEYVLPLLKKYNMKIVLSLIVKDTDDFSNCPNDNIDYSHITWMQLNDMLETHLVEVQNHSYDLHKIRNGRYGCSKKVSESFEEYKDTIMTDLLKAQTEIYKMTGHIPTAFAYPYGKYSDSLDAILKEAGFKATFTCQYGINYISRGSTEDLYHLKRVCRSHRYRIDELVNEAIASKL